MADAPAQHSAPLPATVADVMHPPVTTVEQNDHVAGAAYLMKRAGATALLVMQAQTREPAGIITEADISHLVADREEPERRPDLPADDCPPDRRQHHDKHP